MSLWDWFKEQNKIRYRIVRVYDVFAKLMGHYRIEIRYPWSVSWTRLSGYYQTIGDAEDMINRIKQWDKPFEVAKKL